MPRYMKSIYVDNDEDAKRVQLALESAQLIAPTLDWDQDWDKIKDEDEDPPLYTEGGVMSLPCPLHQKLPRES
jgi:hypothetical protein